MIQVLISMKMKTICNMTEYICKDCGTNYSSAGREIPPTVRWIDGHRCNLELKGKDNLDE